MTGITLIVVKQVMGKVWPRNIELIDPDNCLDVKNQALINYPYISTINELTDKLLFTRPAPSEWYSLQDLPVEFNSIEDLSILEHRPELPAPVDNEHALIYHKAGVYNDCTVVILETVNIDVMFKDRNTTLGRPVIPHIAFQTLDSDLQKLLDEAWKRF